MRLRAIGWILLAVFSSLAWSEAAPKHLTIKEAVLLAVRQNPQMRSAQLQRTVDKFQLEVARDAYATQYKVSGEVNYTNGQDPVTTVSPEISRKFAFGTQARLSSTQDFHDTEHRVSLALDQPLLRGMGMAVNLATVKDAEDQELINQLSLTNVLMETVKRTLESYRQLVQDFQQKKVQQLAYDQAKKVLGSYALKVKVGQLPRANVDQQKTQVVSQQLALEAMDSAIQRDYQALLFVLGLDPKSRLEVDDRVAFGSTKLPSLKNSVELALAHNVAYRQQLIALAAKRRAVMVAKNAQLWDLQAHGTIDSDGTKTASLKLEVPIDDLTRKAQLVAAKTALEQAEIAVKQARDALETQVTNLWRGLQSQQQQISLAKQKSKLADRNYQVAVKSHLHGRASAFEVSEQQQNMVSGRLDVISRRISYLNSLATFHLAIGDGSFKLSTKADKTAG